MYAVMEGKGKRDTHCSSSCRSSGFIFSRSGFCFRFECVSGFSTIKNSSSSCETSKFAFFICRNVEQGRVSGESMEPRHRTYIWYERRLRLFVLQGVPVNLLEPRVLPYVLDPKVLISAPETSLRIPIEEL